MLADQATVRATPWSILLTKLHCMAAAPEASTVDWDAFVSAGGSHSSARGSLATASIGSGDGTWAEFQSGGAEMTPQNAAVSGAHSVYALVQYSQGMVTGHADEWLWHKNLVDTALTCDLLSAGAQTAAAAMSDPFAPPAQRAGHARSYSAPGPSPPPAAPQPHNSTASSAAFPPAGVSAGQQQDPFAPSSSLRATSSGGTPPTAMNGSAGTPQPSAVDPFALKPQAGLSAASAAARLAATPPAQVLH